MTDHATGERLPGAANDDQIYVPQAGEAQLTIRAVLTGCVFGAVVASMNVYIGLQIGWSFGGSLIAAILGFGSWFVLARAFGMNKYSVLETNITQTSGSAAGAMSSTAGFLSSIPALMMLGTELTLWEMMAWALAVGFLGVFYAVPLRNQYVVVEKLRFPTGTATGETIVSMFATGSKALAQAKVLLAFGFLTGFFSLTLYFIEPMESPPIHTWMAQLTGAESWIAAAFTTLAAWKFTISVSPALFGAGLLIGPRVSLSLLAGSIVAWGILGPMSLEQGWVTGAITSVKDGPRGWILWPGVAIMIADALTSLALSWKTIIATFRGSKAAADLGMEEESQRIPNSWWIMGLAAGTVLVTVVSYFVFGIAPWMTVFAVALSWILAAIAVRSTGETDINPTGAMGKVTQLAFAGVAPGATTPNLLCAGISAAGASQASDMMQDLKTGRMLGASPRKQLMAQCCGIAAGIPIAATVFYIFDQAYDIGGDKMPAPAAIVWRGMAELLSNGLGSLPTNAGWAVLAGLLFGILIPILRRFAKPIAPFLPNGLAFGLAFVVFPYHAIIITLGAMALVIWKKFFPVNMKAYVFAVASGILAGDGLMGVAKAGLTLGKVEPWIKAGGGAG